MQIVPVLTECEDAEFCIDDFDLISLYNRFVFENDSRRFIVWDALYVPGSKLERKMSYDWVRREKLLRGLTGKTKEAMNLAAGMLRRYSNRWAGLSKRR